MRKILSNNNLLYKISKNKPHIIVGTILRHWYWCIFATQ